MFIVVNENAFQLPHHSSIHNPLPTRLTPSRQQSAWLWPPSWPSRPGQPQHCAASRHRRHLDDRRPGDHVCCPCRRGVHGRRCSGAWSHGRAARRCARDGRAWGVSREGPSRGRKCWQHQHRRQSASRVRPSSWRRRRPPRRCRSAWHARRACGLLLRRQSRRG